MKQALFRLDVAICISGLVVGVFLSASLLGAFAGPPVDFLPSVHHLADYVTDAVVSSPVLLLTVGSWPLLYFVSIFYFAQSQGEKRLALLIVPAGLLALFLCALGSFGAEMNS